VYTATAEFNGACILSVTVATTGPCGGDSGHGGRTVIDLDMDGGDLEATFKDGTLSINAGGDAELRNLAAGLCWAGDVLAVLADARKRRVHERAGGKCEGCAEAPASRVCDRRSGGEPGERQGLYELVAVCPDCRANLQAGPTPMGLEYARLQAEAARLGRRPAAFRAANGDC
jgi:hypothetical protein